jgi:hypothetical protein
LVKMSVIPRWPPEAAFRPVKAAASWRVWQRAMMAAGGAGVPDGDVPGWVAAGLAGADRVAAGAGGLVPGWACGLLAEQAAASTIVQAARVSAAAPRAGGQRAGAEVIMVSPLSRSEEGCIHLLRLPGGPNGPGWAPHRGSLPAAAARTQRRWPA